MTDMLTRPAPEQQVEKRESPTTPKKIRVVSLGLLIVALLGLVLFASTAGPNQGELDQTRWGQVVDYYTEQYQVMTETRARAEAAHWQDVVNHYARQYELIANSTRQEAPRDEAAHWQAIVDYYEQQWELRSK